MLMRVDLPIPVCPAKSASVTFDRKLLTDTDHIELKPAFQELSLDLCRDTIEPDMGLGNNSGRHYEPRMCCFVTEHRDD